MKQLLETSVYKEFVSPQLCADLLMAGLTPTLSFFWKITDKAILKTYCFDPDNYYVDGDKHTDAINPPKTILPAFQFGDLDKILPNYLFLKLDNEYQISLNTGYKIPQIIKKRLPDAAAQLVLECIRYRIIVLKDAIKIINTFQLNGK